MSTKKPKPPHVYVVEELLPKGRVRIITGCRTRLQAQCLSKCYRIPTRIRKYVRAEK